MSGRHRVLVIEDDPYCAESLGAILESLDCEPTVSDNLEDAARLIEEERFCLVALDLAIKKSAKALKGYTPHGLRVLQLIRARYGSNRGVAMWTPVVVVSGNANETDDVIQMMGDGGVDYVIRKPLVKIAEVQQRLASILAKAGRSEHGMCTEQPGVAVTLGVAFEVTGLRRGAKLLVRVNGRSDAIELSESSVTVLLQLALASTRDEHVHKSKLGREENGVKRISRLTDAIRLALGERGDVIVNERGVGYRLKAGVRVSVDLQKLATLKLRELERVATELVRAQSTV